MNFFKYQLAVVAIMKNEAPYLQEWIDYHLLAGVDHFYLYDNGSTDHTREILHPYIRRGIVDFFDWPGKKKQVPAYNDAVKRYRFACHYMSFLDCDEFILPLHGEDIPSLTSRLLQADPEAAGLAVNWRMFGSSGLVKKPAGGVLDNFIQRAVDGYESNHHIKTIANPRRVQSLVNSHFAFYFGKGYAVSEQGEPVENYWNPVDKLEYICVNHYFTKSKEEWIKRRSLGKADCDGKRTLDEFENPALDEIKDVTIQAYRDQHQAARNDPGSADPSMEDVLLSLLEHFSQGDVLSVEELLTCRYWCRERSGGQEKQLVVDEVIFPLITQVIRNRKIARWEFELLLHLYLEQEISEEIMSNEVGESLYDQADYWASLAVGQDDEECAVYFMQIMGCLTQYFGLHDNHSGVQER